MRRETATVYRGGRRRYFSKLAAARGEAKELIRARCDCEEGDHITPGVPCRYHRDMDHYTAVRDRLARLILRRWAQAGEGA